MTDTFLTTTRTALAVKVAVALVGLQVAFLCALILVDGLAPREQRAAAIRDAFAQGTLTSTEYVPSLWRDADSSTECISHGVGLNPRENAVEAAIVASRPVSDKANTCGALYDAVTQHPLVSWIPYERYWHGYRIYENAMTAWLPLWLVRAINYLLLLGAIGWLAVAASREFGPVASVALIAPAVLIGNLWRVPRTTSHFVSTFVIIAGSAWFLRISRNAERDTILLFAVLSGAVFNYVDFLTTPSWMPMWFAFIALATRSDHKLAMLTAAAWFLGYSVTWASKWTIAIVSSPNPAALLSDIIDIIVYRVNGDFRGISHIPFTSTFVQLDRLFRDGWGTVVVASIAALIWRYAGRPNASSLWLAWPALITTAWVEILSNHSQIHFKTTSRSYAAAIGVALCAWAISCAREPRAR